MSNVNVDLMANGNAQGDLAAQMLANGRMDPGMMRPFIAKDGSIRASVYMGGDITKPENYKNILVNTTGVLRREEWQRLDEAVVDVARYRLSAIDDLVSRGLTYNLGNAMGTTVLEWHDVSEALEADLSMDGVTRAKGDRVVYGTNYLPIPIIHADYEINARVLAASRNLGNPLDTTMAERAARRVAEKLENMLFTAEGSEYKFGGGTIYSYLNYPNRNKLNLAKDWATTATGKEIVQDVLDMKEASIEAYHYGPWMLYIPTGYEVKLDEDYSDAKGTNTIRERILQIAGISGIKVCDSLTAANVLLVQMTSDVVRLVRGMDLQNVQWQTEGNFITKYKVLTIQVPQIRSDQNDKCGIVHMASGLV